jgi:K+-transporting ATPase ATPase B chain
MGLKTPESAVLSAVIFNAVIIVFLIPLAFRGVKFLPQSARYILNRNLIIYGLGGIILPFLGIKVIDIILNVFKIA